MFLPECEDWVRPRCESLLGASLCWPSFFLLYVLASFLTQYYSYCNGSLLLLQAILSKLYECINLYINILAVMSLD